MTLLSAFEDLQRTTLRVISGSLRRLEYFAKLRNDEAGYLHWGLARVHGEERAAKALAESHRAELSKLLSTPIRQLEQDLVNSSNEAGLQGKEYLDRLEKEGSALLPPDPAPGSSRHLGSVLHALSSLLNAVERRTKD